MAACRLQCRRNVIGIVIVIVIVGLNVIICHPDPLFPSSVQRRRRRPRLLLCSFCVYCCISDVIFSIVQRRVQCAQHFCMYPVGGSAAGPGDGAGDGALWLRASVLNCLLDARSKMTNVATVPAGSLCRPAGK